MDNTLWLSITDNTFGHFPPIRTTHPNLKAPSLARNEGQVKQLLLLYKRVIQCFIVLLLL